MSLFIAIIVLSVLKLTFTIGNFIAAKRLNLPVKQFAIGVDLGKPIFAKKYANTEFVIYPFFWGGFLTYDDDFDPEVKCSSNQKLFLALSSFLTMFIVCIFIGLIGINFVQSGYWETTVKFAPESSVFNYFKQIHISKED